MSLALMGTACKYTVFFLLKKRRWSNVGNHLLNLQRFVYMKHYEIANGNKLKEKLVYVILYDYNFREKTKN